MFTSHFICSLKSHQHYGSFLNFYRYTMMTQNFCFCNLHIIHFHILCVLISQVSQ